MYAIVSTGGKQYKVAPGDVIDVEKIEAEPGDSVELPVLLINNDGSVTASPEALASAKVTCKVVDQFRGKKDLVFKLHKRKRYHRLNGHRQYHTKLEVIDVPAV